MKENSSLIESESAEVSTKQTHPLIQLGVVAVGTKIGATVIIKLARHPVLLLGMGIASGFYLNKNRREIIEAAKQLKEKGLKLLNKKADD